MKKNTDQISEAYYNELGKEFGTKVRNRIHWILEEAKGETILDVGCSQGLVSILLAREGKDVVGIDILEEAITYAKQQLEEEEEPTRKHVQLVHDNFIDYPFDQKFDCIIMGEILEHISDPARFLKKASDLLNPNGKLIITVPFGINDYFDHKHTYYLQDMFKFQTDQLHLTNLNFLGNWVGAVYQLDHTLQNKVFDEALFGQFEKALFKHEAKYLEQLIELKKENKRLREESDQKFLDEKVEKVKYQKALYEQYEAEEAIIKSHKRIENQLKDLKVKYNNLKTSKLGKLTTRYWKWRRRRSN